MTRDWPRRVGQALPLWGAVGGPILLWWPGALRLPALCLPAPDPPRGARAG